MSQTCWLGRAEHIGKSAASSGHLIPVSVAVDPPHDRLVVAVPLLLNAADTFVSPGRQTEAEPVLNRHDQPMAALGVMDKLREIRRRPGPHTGEAGFDAFGVILVNMQNDGSPVLLDSAPPAPQPGDDFHYDRMILRASHRYDSDFGNV